jgi:hypothetical protein
MFQLVRTYEPIADATGIVYRPHAYGEVQPDGSWDGWLVFFPIPAGTAIATDRETTQRSFADLVRWSSTVGLVYLEGALERALRIQLDPTLSARFAELALLEAPSSLLEGPSSEDAAVLETAAAQAREDADAAMSDAAAHEAAAAAARAEARERLEDARALERNLEETVAPVTEMAPVTEVAPVMDVAPVVIREEVRHQVQARRSQAADRRATTGTRRKSKKKKS